MIDNQENRTNPTAKIDLTKYEREDEKSIEYWREAALKDFTGLRTKRWLEEFGQKYVNDLEKSAKPYSVLWLDMNDLGKVNDQLEGREKEGDLYLVDVAKRLADPDEGGFRLTDTVIHLHGDTFIIIMPSTSKQTARNAIFRVMNSVNKFVGNKYHLPPTFSVGISGSTDDKIQTADEILEQALIAMQYAKKELPNGITVKIFEREWQHVSYKK